VSAPMLAAHGVRKNFGHVEALCGVDLEVAAGEVVAIIGPSGSGKSTFLRCLNGLETITAGEIVVEGRPVARVGVEGLPDVVDSRQLSQLRAKLGMVFQRFNLFPHRTALENIIEGPVHVRGVDAKTARREALDLLDQVNLTERADHYPAQLSGGEQQRVAIARALAMKPRAMLFDEATSALDPETVGDVLSVMRDLARGGMTMIVVTHEIHFARAVADRVIVMESGVVIDRGHPSSVLVAPANSRTREFLRRVLEPELLDAPQPAGGSVDLSAARALPSASHRLNTN
jgi:polar amino acid transport system ATP-binding protein